MGTDKSTATSTAPKSNESDPRPLAAYHLGFLLSFFTFVRENPPGPERRRCWFRGADGAFWPGSTRLTESFEQARACRSAVHHLAEVIDARTLSLFDSAIREICEVCDPQAALETGESEPSLLRKEIRFDDLCDNLTQIATCPLNSNAILDGCFRLGAALGSCLGRVTLKREPDVALLVSSAASLPERVKGEGLAVRILAGKAGQVDSGLLREILMECGKERELGKQTTVIQQVELLHSVLQQELRQIKAHYDEQSEKVPLWTRIQVIRDKNQPFVVFDQLPVSVRPEMAEVMFELVNAKGDWRSGPQMQKKNRQLEDVRIDREIQKAPEILQNVIQCGGNKGYRLSDESLE